MSSKTPVWDARQGFGWSVATMAILIVIAALLLGAMGCRTAGTADQQAKLSWKNVTVHGSVTVGSGDRTLETDQVAGKETGVTAATAQATVQDAAVGVGGSTVDKQDSGGTNTASESAQPK